MTDAPSGIVKNASGLYLLDDESTVRLRKIVSEQGLAAVARALKVSRGVVSAAAGGIGVRRGSLEMLRDALKRLDKANEKAKSE